MSYTLKLISRLTKLLRTYCTKFPWKKSLFLKDQNVTQGVNCNHYFQKMVNPRVNTALHNKNKIYILVYFFKFSTLILFFGGVSPRPPPQHFETIFSLFCTEISTNNFL